MKRRRMIIFISIIAVLGVMLIFSLKKNPVDSSVTEARYYATGDKNIFLKLARMVDGICYYVASAITKGISSLFSLFL